MATPYLICEMLYLVIETVEDTLRGDNDQLLITLIDVLLMPLAACPLCNRGSIWNRIAHPTMEDFKRLGLNSLRETGICMR